MSRKQVGGDHYEKLAIQPVEYCRKNGMQGLESSVVRYVTRHQDKNGSEDIKKAIDCLKLILEYDYNEQT